jgi:hypothetical protein
MPTPIHEVRKFQQQVRADFAAFQVKFGCSAKKAIDLLNARGQKSSTRKILTLGELRQLIDRRIGEEDFLRLKSFAKNL